jgi:hypothetical protein
MSVDRRGPDVIFEEFPLHGSRLSALHGSRTTTNQGGYGYSVSTPGHLESRRIKLGSLKRSQRSPPSRWLGVHVVRHTALR